MQSVRERQPAPTTGRAGASHQRGRRRRSLGHRGRPQRRGGRWLAGALDGGESDASSGAAHPQGTVRLSPAARPSATASRPAHKPTPSRARSEVPLKGSGRFVTAQASGAKVGHGKRLLRYAVEVESGLDISPTRAANEIAGILAARRGWIHNGVSSFQLVSAGQPYDLKVMIATPATADALCWEGIHQDTGGELNCEIPKGVVVNLKRWVEGSPMFGGPIEDYRALIINHEMGHFLGYTHMTCAGPGQLAPVMMQQIKGLSGCVANAWPYDANGRLVSGPHVP
jgi:uncharacterized protein DUF3152